MTRKLVPHQLPLTNQLIKYSVCSLDRNSRFSFTFHPKMLVRNLYCWWKYESCGIFGGDSNNILIEFRAAKPPFRKWQSQRCHHVRSLKKKKNLQFVYILSSKKYNNICIHFLVGIKTRKKNLLQFGDTCFSNTVFFQKIENFTKKPPPLEFITYELVVLVIFFSSFPHHDSPVGLCHSQHQGGEEAKWLPSQWQLSAGWNTASRREFY